MNQLFNPSYHEIHTIYSQEIPDFFLPFFESATLRRLGDISQNCGTEYAKFYDFKFNLSRLDHSLGVGLIVWYFTRDQKQALAGLFHDISHSVFSHVGDFVLGDAIYQESSEQHTTKLISEDPVIMRELQKLGLSVSDVDDYTKYAIADNNGPQLSADRLEYTLSSAITLGHRTIDQIRAMFQNITKTLNEKGEDELIFRDLAIAEDFGLLSIENDSGCFSSYESIASMSYLAEILKYMLEKKMITTMEMYTLGDSDIIQMIVTSNDTKLIGMWEFINNTRYYKIHLTKPANCDKFLVNSLAKRRYIDPLVFV